MPTFSIHIVNSDFVSSSSVDAPSSEAARSEALRIGAEEVCKGNLFFAAEIRIQNSDETIERLVVAIEASLQ
jgi:hypothetical protein